MSDYNRCVAHNLLRCPLCAPVDAHHAVIPAGAHVASAGWSPEDALDQSMGASSAKPVVQTQAPAIDKQALEAIERRKAMLAGAPSEVNFGTVPPGVKVEPVVETPAPVQRQRTVEDIIPEKFEAIRAEDEPFKPTSNDPFMSAAQDFSQAKKLLEIAQKKLELAKISVEELTITCTSLAASMEAARQRCADLVLNS